MAYSNIFTGHPQTRIIKDIKDPENDIEYYCPIFGLHDNGLDHLGNLVIDILNGEKGAEFTPIKKVSEKKGWEIIRYCTVRDALYGLKKELLGLENINDS